MTEGRTTNERAEESLCREDDQAHTSDFGHSRDTADTGDWERAHTELLRLSRQRARLDSDEAHWLVRALRAGAHTRLGYASFAEYVERLFGYSPRWTAEKLRVAEALERLPAHSRALANGELSWSSARELTRVATPETEAEWLASAEGLTAREVENLVSGHHPGSLPADPPDPAAKRHVLRFEVSPLAFAAFREALAKLRRDSDATLDDDEALLLMARQVLGGPTDAGHSSYQMALTVCESCRRGKMHAHGELVEVESDTIEMAACDAQSFAISARGERTHVGHTESRASQSIPPSVRRLVHHRDGGRCRVPGCRHATFVDVHHLDPKADGGSNDPENLITLCSAHHRALHRGELVAQGSASTGLEFRHADGSRYGTRHASPRVSTAVTTAFQALRSLGFREREARQAIDRVTPHVGDEPSAEMVLRRALAELVKPTSTSEPRVSGRKAA